MPDEVTTEIPTTETPPAEVSSEASPVETTQVETSQTPTLETVPDAPVREDATPISETEEAGLEKVKEEAFSEMADDMLAEDKDEFGTKEVKDPPLEPIEAKVETPPQETKIPDAVPTPAAEVTPPAEVVVPKAEEVVAAEIPAKPEEPAKVETPEVTPTVTTPEKDLMALLNERRDETIDVLAKNHYNLSDEQFREVDENPREALPKLMSSVYLDAVQGAASTILGQLPQIMQAVNIRQAAEAKAETTFYEMFPALNDEKYKEHIAKVTNMHRQLNPKATVDEMIRDVGVQASVAFKLPIPEESRVVKRTVETVIPHVPAAAGGLKPSAPIAPGSVNPFETMAEEIMKEDAS